MNKEKSLKFREAANTILSFREDIFNKEFNNEDDIKLAIEVGVLLLHAGGNNMLYNMKFRERMSSIIRNNYFISRSKNNPNGVDLDSIQTSECKSATFKNKNFFINWNLTIGEIDKVYNKINNADPKYSANTQNDVFFLVFKAADGAPIIAFYVNSEDFGKTIQPLLEEKYKELMEKSDQLKKKSRDSLRLTLSSFMNCKSLDIAYVNKDNESIFVEESFIEKLDKKSVFYKTLMVHINNELVSVVNKKDL